MSDNVVVNDGGQTPTPSAPAAAPASAASASSPTTGTPQAPATGAPTDQNPGPGWVPRYRIDETRAAAQKEFNSQWAAREAKYQAELEQERARVRALTGVTQPNPQDQEAEQIRQQFSKIFPGLGRLSDEKIAQLESLLERSGNLEAAEQHIWDNHGRATMDRLYGMAEKTYGAALSPEQKAAIHEHFTGIVMSSPQMTERYSKDPGFVDQYWKSFTSTFIDPVRRASTVQAASRAPQALPQDTPSGAPRIPGPPAPKDLDDRVAAGWAAYQARTGNSGS